MSFVAHNGLPGRCAATVMLLLAWALPALAAEPAAPAPAAQIKADEVERLVATLEDGKARGQLVEQLKALVAAQRAAGPAPAAAAAPAAETDAVTPLPAPIGALGDKAAEAVANKLAAHPPVEDHPWRIFGIFGALLAAVAVGDHFLRRLLRLALGHRPGDAHARAKRHLRRLRLALHGSLGLAALLVLAQFGGIDALGFLVSETGRRALSSAISIALVLGGAVLVWAVLNGIIEHYLSATDADGTLLQRSGRVRTLLPLARTAAFVLLVTVVGLILLSELGVNIAPLLAGAGVLGIAIGFGSQKLVQDVITGAFILFEDTVAIGDSVKLGEHAGAVEAISIRAIRLRDAAGALHTVPFSAVSTVINLTRGFNYAVFDIAVASGVDTDGLTGLLGDLGAELRADPHWGTVMLAPVEVLGVERFDHSQVVMRAQVKTSPAERAAFEREFHRRLRQRLDAAGIALPFPQMQVWVVPPASVVEQGVGVGGLDHLAGGLPVEAGAAERG